MRSLQKESQTLQLAEVRVSMVGGQGVEVQGGQGAPQQVRLLPGDLIPPHQEVASRETREVIKKILLVTVTEHRAVTMEHRAKDILQAGARAGGLSGQETGGGTRESWRTARSLSSWRSCSRRVKLCSFGNSKDNEPPGEHESSRMQKSTRKDHFVLYLSLLNVVWLSAKMFERLDERLAMRSHLKFFILEIIQRSKNPPDKLLVANHHPESSPD